MYMRFFHSQSMPKNTFKQINTTDVILSEDVYLRFKAMGGRFTWDTVTDCFNGITEFKGEVTSFSIQE